MNIKIENHGDMFRFTEPSSGQIQNTVPVHSVSEQNRAVPLLPLWAVRPVQSLSACTRVYFNFIFFFREY